MRMEHAAAGGYVIGSCGERRAYVVVGAIFDRKRQDVNPNCRAER